MKILLTGGAGCLGSNLIEHWLPKGFEIFVIDNFATGKREVLPSVSGLTVYEGDISDETAVLKCFEQFKPTLVVHSAASYKDPDDWCEDISTNVLGTVNIIKASLEYQIEKFINFQTALCYGRPKEIPIPNDHTLAPFTSYGISKTAGEHFLLNSGLPAISLRLANICGPRLAIGPIPTFYKRLKEGKDCFCSDSVRDFLDISDFFAIIDKIISADIPTGAFNVSTGKGYSIHDVFMAVASYLDIDPPEVPIVPTGDDDVAQVVLDPAETERMLNWRAKVDFKETIRRQLAWYDAYGVNDIYSHLAAPTSVSTES